MNIGGVSDYSSLMRNYYVPTIPSVRPENIDDHSRQSDVAQTAYVTDIREEASVTAPIRQDAALEDISLTFNKQEGFDYIGQDSDIHALDVEKAISDMKKDKVLEQYQYFVGSARNLVTDSADGGVIAKF